MATKKKATKKAAPKKASPKPKAAAKPKGPSKAAMAAALKEKMIPLPESGDVADMEHRLRHWKSFDEGGFGFMIRLHRNAGARYADHPLSLLTAPRKALYWLPASEMTDRILATRRVVVVGRVQQPSDKMVVIDVPTDYEQRFGA
tara:strand:+ start:1112 stop:1546 length:435 start_codon:yes stop_codon:yes gene_type:complete